MRMQFIIKKTDFDFLFLKAKNPKYIIHAYMYVQGSVVVETNGARWLKTKHKN